MAIYYTHPTVTLIFLVLVGLGFLLSVLAFFVLAYLPSPLLSRLYAQYIDRPRRKQETEPSRRTP